MAIFFTYIKTNLDKVEEKVSIFDYTILLIKNKPNDMLIEQVLHQANLTNPIQVVEDEEQTIAYLRGQNTYNDRSCYPLPGLIILDLKSP